MKDIVIHRISWHLQGDSRGGEIAEDLVRAYKPLVAWLHQKGLLSNLELASKPIDNNFEIRVSDLTDDGYNLFRLAHDRWLKALSRIPIGELTECAAEKKIKTIWEKYFSKLKHGD